MPTLQHYIEFKFVLKLDMHKQSKILFEEYMKLKFMTKMGFWVNRMKCAWSLAKYSGNVHHAKNKDNENPAIIFFQ